MSLHPSTARIVAPCLLAVAVAAVLVLCLLVGAPTTDDIGSWRWMVARAA
jgi:hypothetical protein